MRSLLNVLIEVWHLFVDDGAFAAAIVAWPAVVWLLRVQTWLAADWAGGFLFAGLALILVMSAFFKSGLTPSKR
jgi:hypothetical protein